MPVLKWFRKIVSGSDAAKAPEDPDARRAWFNAQISAWQAQWHDLFDVDANVGLAAGETRPEPLPDDVMSDNRLIFDLSQATPETRAKCFALLPMGQEMHDRFESYMSGTSVQMTETTARKQVKTVIALVEEIGPNEEVNFSKIEVVNRDTKEGLEALKFADDITILLEQSAFEPRPAADFPKSAAKHFLTEPLFATAGNYYQLHEWVTAVLQGGAVDALHTALYEMWCGGWQVFLDENGVILAQRRV